MDVDLPLQRLGIAEDGPRLAVFTLFMCLHEGHHAITIHAPMQTGKQCRIMGLVVPIDSPPVALVHAHKLLMAALVAVACRLRKEASLRSLLEVWVH